MTRDLPGVTTGETWTTSGERDTGEGGGGGVAVVVARRVFVWVLILMGAVRYTVERGGFHLFVVD